MKLKWWQFHSPSSLPIDQEKDRIPKLLQSSKNEWTTNAEGTVRTTDRERQGPAEGKGQTYFPNTGTNRNNYLATCSPIMVSPSFNLLAANLEKKKIPCLINKSIWEMGSWVSSLMFNHRGSVCRKETQMHEGSPAGQDVGGKLGQVIQCWDPKGAFWWYFSMKWTWDSNHNAPWWASFYQWLEKHTGTQVPLGTCYPKQ